MIGYEPNELNSNTTASPIENAIPIAGLEEMTGADLLISPIKAPAKTLDQIQAHLAAGAELVQIKRGWDFGSSVLDGRLKDALIRMTAAGAPIKRRSLFRTGHITPGDLLPSGRDWEGLIGGKPAPHDERQQPIGYYALKAAEASWSDRGGGFVFVEPHERMIEGWALRRELRLKKYAAEPVHKFFPPLQEVPEHLVDAGTFQTLERASWGERVLAALIGPEVGCRVYAYCGSLWAAFVFLSDERNLKLKDKPRGLGPSHFAKFKDRAGLKPGQVFIVPEVDEEAA